MLILVSSLTSLMEVFLVSVNRSTIKPVLRGHRWDKEKWPCKTGDLLKEVQFILIFYDKKKVTF
jgi:hypothetical protein